jgi:predicted RNase H-like nuclease
MIAGIDGCPAGWIAVVHPLARPQQSELMLFASFADVLSHRPKLTTIAVDIPIGLPDQIAGGGRMADREARAVLGQRQSSVFAVPSRTAVMCTDYREACAVALATSDPPRKVSKQAFNIFAKIREVDALMTAQRQDQVFETHPEVAFWSLNGEKPLDLAKKVKSRPNPPGLAYRRDLLRSAGYPDAILHSGEFARSKVGPDDILDACVNAWSAGRITQGQAICFPAAPSRDGRGLRMEIWG